MKEIDLVGLPADQLMQKVAALPPRTVALFFGYSQDSVQPLMGFYDMLAWVGRRLPTYCMDGEQCLIHGGIGGAQEPFEQELAQTVELAARVLSGERPDEIPVVNETAGSDLVDWRQLRRWHINEAALPPGTVVANREPTLWDRDRNYILAALALIVVQALLVLGLLWQRARKRRAEAVLLESEERFRLVSNNAPVMIWMSGEDKLCTYFNKPWLEFRGRSSEAECGNGWVEGVHPDDLQKCLETYTQCFDQRNQFRMEYRLRRHDGVFRWIMDLGVPRFNADGSFAGYIGSVIDVTDQKLAHEALQKVSGQLIEAQEKERSRIARDLHDDISQRLVLLSMALEQANRGQKGSAGSAKQRLEEIRKNCSEIANDVQSLPHELHSSKLDYLGIVAAIRGFCKEFAEQEEVTVDFAEQNVPKHLPRDVSLCLFRVTQEALHNAAKHSGTDQFWVELRALGNDIRLEVGDHGAGFDVDNATTTSGLGLVSMQERVHLVQGHLTVESKSGVGTKIIANVPAAAPTSAVDAEKVVSASRVA